MIWVGLLGAAYTVGAQRHLAIDLLTLMLSSRKQALLSVIINLLIFLFAGSVIVTGGVKLIEKRCRPPRSQPQCRSRWAMCI